MKRRSFIKAFPFVGAAVAMPAPVASAATLAEGTAQFVIDGQIVTVATAVDRLKGKPLCVVAREDGSIGLERAWNGIQWRWKCRRSGYYDVSAQESWPCTIIGVVVDQEAENAV